MHKNISKQMDAMRSKSMTIPVKTVQIDNLPSSSFSISEYDDKEDPNFFVKDDNYHRLPPGVQEAIDKGLARAKHSAFYY